MSSWDSRQRYIDRLHDQRPRGGFTGTIPTIPDDYHDESNIYSKPLSNANMLKRLEKINHPFPRKRHRAPDKMGQQCILSSIVNTWLRAVGQSAAEQIEEEDELELVEAPRPPPRAPHEGGHRNRYPPPTLLLPEFRSRASHAEHGRSTRIITPTPAATTPATTTPATATPATATPATATPPLAKQETVKAEQVTPSLASPKEQQSPEFATPAATGPIQVPVMMTLKEYKDTLHRLSQQSPEQLKDLAQTFGIKTSTRQLNNPNEVYKRIVEYNHYKLPKSLKKTSEKAVDRITEKYLSTPYKTLQNLFKRFWISTSCGNHSHESHPNKKRGKKINFSLFFWEMEIFN